MCTPPTRAGGTGVEAIVRYREEDIAVTMPERAKPTVSLQLPEKVWYIDGILVLTNMRLVFLPQSIQGDFFPAVFACDRPAYLSIYLASIDHLVLVQNQRKTKLRSFTIGQVGGLPSRIDKLEVHCCDFVRYKFCFNSPHRQRRSLLEKLGSGGAGSGSGGGGQLSSFSESLRASLMDGIHRSRIGGQQQQSGQQHLPLQAKGSAASTASAAASTTGSSTDGTSDLAHFLSNMCLFAFGSRRDANCSTGLFPCRWTDYARYLTREWSGRGPVASVALSGGGSVRAILPLLPNSPATLSSQEVEYYRDCGYPRLVLTFSDDPPVAVLRSARPRDDAPSNFFKQSMEFETSLRDRYAAVHQFDCDRLLPRLKAVRQARKLLLRHCVSRAGASDAMSLDKVRSDSDSGFLSGLESTGWLQLVHRCLQQAALLAGMVRSERCTVWLLEAADRDWNCLLASLVCLILCPAARSLAGFERLVRLEWVSRHPFRARLLGLFDDAAATTAAASAAESESEAASVSAPSPDPVAAAPGSGDGTWAPLFLLFLDCAWQLTRRYPDRFEPSSVYLTLLHDVAQWPVFQENGLARLDDVLFRETPSQLGSLFDWPVYVSEATRQLFSNRLYARAASGPPDDCLDTGELAWRLYEVQFWSENYARNARFASTDKLMPNCVYTGPTVQGLQRLLDDGGGGGGGPGRAAANNKKNNNNNNNNNSRISAPTRQACYYGDESGQRSRNSAAPFGWSAGLIVDRLLRNHLKEAGADFTQQLDPRALK